MRVARRTVLQRLRALRGEQVRQHPHLLGLRQPGVERGQRSFLRQGGLRRLARAREAAGQQLRQCIEQGRIQGALLLLQAPLARLQGQGEQGRQAAQRHVQQGERRQQEQQHEIQRKVDPPRGPEDGDRALVVAGEQRHRGGDAEQGEKPECRAH
jgi:hypothetical protein